MRQGSQIGNHFQLEIKRCLLSRLKLRGGLYFNDPWSPCKGGMFNAVARIR